MKIFVDKNILTDQSAVYNVRLTRFEDMPRSIDTLVFHATGRAEAEYVAQAFANAINDYTTETAEYQGMPD